MVTLLYAGNLGLGHELETVIRAVWKLGPDGSLKVLIVGNGSAWRQLRELVILLRLGNVEFRLPVPLCELSNLLATGDIHLVSQRPGTQGLIVPSKVYGILAAGRPVFFVGPSDCESAMIVHDSGAGFVVEPGDVSGAASALRNLATNADLRRTMGQSARRYYEEHFGRDKSVSSIVNAIESTGGAGSGT